MNEVVGFFVGLLSIIYLGISALFERVPAWFLLALIPLYFFWWMIRLISDQLGQLRVALEDISENIQAQHSTLKEIKRELDGSAARGRAELVEFARELRTFAAGTISSSSSDPSTPDPLGRPTPPT